MQTRGGKTLYSAGDVVAFLECEHATTLALVDLVTPLPRAQDDEAAVLVQHKGFAHEARYFDSLKASASSVAQIASDGTPDARAEATRQAMREGRDVIYQAALLSGPLFGVADFLRRVERPSALGAYGYEVVDTKLARNEKAKFIVQLCFYSDLLAHEQGVDPAAMHVVLGDGVERTYRVANYSRYFRLVRDRFVAFVGRHPNGTYPEQCAYCELCTWRDVCAAQWKADDHLNQVAGIRRDQIERLREAGVSTLEALAQVDDVASFGKPPAATVAKLRSQAALQLAYRRTGEHRTEPIELDPQARRGFYRMPEPDAGDVFFDMEGDPFEPDGLEYLFGLRFFDAGALRFKAFWAHDRAQERAAFEALMDFFADRMRRFPRMHIYHYAHYEPTALKRLMCLHGAREAEVDDLLRRGTFVDLYRVVCEALRASTAGYSIKDIETFYMPPREGDIRTAGASIVHYERWRETRDAAELESIERYNDDDCRSTHLLRDWLLQRRPPGLTWYAGERPADDAGEAPRLSERIARIETALQTYRGALLGNLPADRDAWGVDERVRELVFELLDFHRRADKPQWWAMYARRDMTDDDLIDDIECLGGLRRSAERPPEKEKRSLVYTFTFPEQETKLRAGSDCYRTDTSARLGEIVALDGAARHRAHQDRVEGPGSAGTVDRPPRSDRERRAARGRVALRRFADRR